MFHCGFDVHFPNIGDVEQLCVCSLATCVSFGGMNVCWGFFAVGFVRAVGGS